MSANRSRRARSRAPWTVGLALCASAGALQAGGDVSVRVDRAGNLVVEGDDEDNEILISPVDIGIGTVLGLGTTRVNGGDSATFSGVDGDFRIRMRGGNDRVLVSDGDGNRVPDDLDISTGSGDDSVLVQGFFVDDDLRIDSGAGNDTIELANTVVVAERTSIHTGSGDDRLFLEPAEVPDLLIVFGDDVTIRTSSGRDFVDLSGALFRQGLDVDLGSGDDMGDTLGLQGGVSVCGCRF